jgi:uncharacterized membrane protein
MSALFALVATVLTSFLPILNKYLLREAHPRIRGLVGYVTALFKLSAVLTILWAWWFLGEGQIKSRLLGTSVMMVGGLLVAV